MADQTPTPAAPTPTPWYLQPALWIAVLTPLCGLIATKLGVVLDAAQVAGILIPVLGLIVGLLHHDATVTAAQIDAHAQTTSAQVTATAGANAGSAAEALK